MEEQAATLLQALKKPSTAVDTKIQQFNSLKSNIKHLRVPEASQAPIFECIKLAISASTSAALVSTGLSTLGHLLKRLVLQNQTAIITNQSHKLLPVLLEKLGDARESHRNAASQLLSDLWPLCHDEVENLVRDSAMKGTNPRAKETSMQWLVKMNKNEGLQFRSFVPLLIANLEDADAGVREVAKNAVVDLFRNAPEHAKADLRKQLIAHNVRKSIASYITSHLSDAMPSGVEVDTSEMPTISTARAQTLQPDTGIADSVLSEAPPPTEAVPMDPIQVYTQRELDEIFREMTPHFEGRESEQNWLPRDKSTTKLRRITIGNAPSEFHAAFVAGIKSLLDGILKVANSLRTTMSTNGCLLIQDLAKILGTSMDPWAEILLQNFIKMCAATKNIAAQNGNVTVDTIFSNISYNNRVMQHVTFASQDKNVQPRMFSAGWVKTLIRKHKSPVEHSGGLESLEKIIKKGLADANPKVREAYRATYWTFALVWPQKAEAIMGTLDAKSKGLLEKDSNNPNASLASSQSSTAGSFSKSVGPGGAAARSTLKEKIAEQKRARLAAKGVPERPISAQASYSPVKSNSTTMLGSRTTSTASVARPPSAMSNGSSKSVLSSSNANGTGSLMSGTVRRPMRRPELTRPATADPYASRRAGKNVTPSMTPEKTPARETAKKSVAPKSTVRPRTKTNESRPSPNISPIRSKSRLAQSQSHQASHQKAASIDTARRGSPAVSPPRNEDSTTVAPFGKTSNHSEAGALPIRQRPERQAPTDDETMDLGDDAGFTMVIPNMKLPQPSGQATAQRSPPKQLPMRFDSASPRSVALNSPRSVTDLANGLSLGGSRTPRRGSPDRFKSAQAQEEVQVYEDPFTGNEVDAPPQELEKPVLEELPLNEKNGERRLSDASMGSDTMMGAESTPSGDRLRGHHKTTSTGSIMHAEGTSEAQGSNNRADVVKNRQLLTSGINKIKARTVEAHMFRRLQDMIKSNQDIWGPDDEKFGELLLSCLEYLEAPPETLKAPPAKAANLKVQVLATIRAMLALYRKETAIYFTRVLCAVLRTKAYYDNSSHISSDLETTADEIVKYGQTGDCLNAVLDLIQSSNETLPPSSTDSDSAPISNRTITFALTTLASLLQVAHAKSVTVTSGQTQRLGQTAVRFLDDTDADVRKADLEFCIALHERIGGEKDVFWKAVAGAREQHLNLITYFLARRGKA